MLRRWRANWNALIQNAKYRENVVLASANAVGNLQAAANAAAVGGTNDGNAAGGSAVAAALSDPHGKVKQLEQLAKNLKFDTVSQMFLAWTAKNQTSVSVVASCSTVEQLEEILGAMAVRKT